MQFIINFNIFKIHTLSNEFVTSYLVCKSREWLYMCVSHLYNFHVWLSMHFSFTKKNLFDHVTHGSIRRLTLRKISKYKNVFNLFQFQGT